MTSLRGLRRFSPRDFRWTSRADLCRAISSMLERGAVPSIGAGGSFGDVTPESRFRRKSICLLSALAGDEVAPFLTQLLTSSHEHSISRDAAYRALHRLAVRIDASRWIEWVDSLRAEDQHGLEFAGMALSLCAPEEALLRRLRSAGAVEVEKMGGAMLARPPRSGNPAARCLLLDQWLDAWRSGKYVKPDWLLAARASRELEVDEPFLAVCSQLAGERVHNRLWFAAGADAVMARRLADKLGVRHDLAEKLMLPSELLLEQFGIAGLSERILSAMSVAASHLAKRRCPSGVHSHFHHALRLLMAWSDRTFDALFVDCVQAAELEPLRSDLVRGLWHRDPEAAWELALRSMKGQAPPSVGTHVAALMSHDPPSRAEALFHWAVDHAGGRPQAYSVIALEHLGYAGPEWRCRLAELAEEPLPILRFNARAALARRGEKRWLEEVVERAEQDPSENVRAEALHALGDADPERFLPVLGRAFLEDHSPDDVCCSPGAEAASYELARWGTPDAMTVLVRGFFHVTTSCLFSGVMSHLHAFAARRAGWWVLSPYGRGNRPSARSYSREWKVVAERAVGMISRASATANED